ncbi:MAG: D-aminoacylase [Gemmatimonadaceae bacterium]
MKQPTGDIAGTAPAERPHVAPDATTGSNRREFVAAGAASLLALGGMPALRLQRTDHDLVIRRGTIFDGRGGEGVEGDVAITGGNIVAIGRSLSAKGREEIDARGLAVAPGFIDIHSHADGSLDEDPRAESVVRQGVTTIVAGQDGSSRAWGDESGAGSFATYFGRRDASGASVNVACMVGLGTVRARVVGDDDRPATPAELARMASLVERALRDGACGASSGLEYTPGAFAPSAELIALCRPLAARGLPYATHMRNEDDQLLDAIDESIAVARGARCPLQISHLKTQGPRNWDKLDLVFRRIEESRRAGLDVTFDRYPYTAYQTGLTNLFPVWSRDGGSAAFLKRLDDVPVAARIRTETLGKVELIGGWDNVLVASVRASEDRAAEGKRLGTYAASLGAEPYAVAVALLRRSDLNVGMVGFAMSEDNLDRILAHPLAMVCSDGGSFAVEGPTRRGSPHPRGLGTFPRVLGRYVRERKALTLADAIHKMTAAPAARLRIAHRGRLVTGFAADVVVFDPATVADRATYESPFQYPVGISTVVVNGAVALHAGERRPGAQGRALRAKG